MRIFNLSIDGKTYPACCGIRALAQLQKRYGSLKEFENKIFSRSDDTEKSENYLDEIDYQALLDTTILFLQVRKLLIKRLCMQFLIRQNLQQKFLLHMQAQCFRKMRTMKKTRRARRRENKFRLV